MNARFYKYLNDSNMIFESYHDPKYKENLFHDTEDEASKTSLENIKKNCRKALIRNTVQEIHAYYYCRGQ